MLKKTRVNVFEMANIIMNPEKLAKLQEQARNSGKGAPRRKLKKTSKAVNDDKKALVALKKINVRPLTGFDEVNFFGDDESVLHFPNPKGQKI